MVDFRNPHLTGEFHPYTVTSASLPRLCNASRSHPPGECQAKESNIGIERRAGTDQIAVAAGPIHTADRWPVFVGPERRHGEGGGLPRVHVVPFVRHHLLGRVGGVVERVVLPAPFAGLDTPHLTVNGDHRLHESIQLFEALGLGGLDHQCACHREGQRGRMKPVVRETLGDVLRGDACSPRHGSHIDDALMGNTSVGPCVQHREVGIETSGKVIR